MGELKSHGGSYSQARLVRYSIVANYQINIENIKIYKDLQYNTKINIYEAAYLKL
jgi:hypothetical protein